MLFMWCGAMRDNVAGVKDQGYEEVYEREEAGYRNASTSKKLEMLGHETEEENNMDWGMNKTIY